MGSMNVEGPTYPQWEHAWQKYGPAVDDQIIDHYSHLGAAPPDHAALTEQLHSWFNHQNLDPGTRQEFEMFEDDPQAFRQLVDDRVEVLRRAGQLAAPRTMQAGAASNAAAVPRAIPSPAAGGDDLPGFVADAQSAGELDSANQAYRATPVSDVSLPPPHAPARG